MVSCLSSIVKSMRTWYKNKTGCHHKFISACQDIWDSKRCDLVEISLMFIHPETFQHFEVSAGLVHITGKKASEIAHDTLTLLKRYGITQQDLFMAVNGTTASALLAGRLIVCFKDSGTCGMHKCELNTKLTTGQVVRKKKKQVVDLFPEMEKFRTNTRKFATWIIDTKQYESFVKRLTHGLQPLKLETPN